MCASERMHRKLEPPALHNSWLMVKASEVVGGKAELHSCAESCSSGTLVGSCNGNHLSLSPMPFLPHSYMTEAT